MAFPNVIYQYTHDYMQISYLTEDIKKENTQKWLSRWNEICHISKENNFELLVTVQPMLGTSDREMHHIEKKIVESPKHKKIFEFLNALGDSLDGLQCTSLDFRNTFDGIKEHVFFSSVHIGDFGNKIIAERISTEISPFIENHIKDKKYE